MTCDADPAEKDSNLKGSKFVRIQGFFTPKLICGTLDFEAVLLEPTTFQDYFGSSMSAVKKL